MGDLGEKVAGIDARFAAFEKYEHERWHKLNNDLQPVVALPERVTRDIAKLQGTFEGRINSVSKELERAITSAVEKAMASVNADVAELRADVDALKLANSGQEGERTVLKSILQSPLLVYVVMVAGIVWAALTGRLK
jgi:hypothetical protein